MSRIVSENTPESGTLATDHEFKSTERGMRNRRVLFEAIK